MSPRLLTVLAALLALPTLAYAEALGGAGMIRQLEINTQSADAYLQYHGRVVVAEAKVVTEYRWGGTSCGTRILDESQVASLQRAMADGLRIQPRYQEGQGDAKCLVGFAFSG